LSRLRVAIVGAGGIAEGHHLPALREHPDEVELVAIMDPDPRRADAFVTAHGVPRHYGALDELLEETGPDLVHITSPPGVHAEQAVACLQAGASVWCEKPACASLAELDLVADAETGSAGRFSVVQQWRSGSAVKHLRSLISVGALGRPRVAQAASTWYRDARYYAVPWRGRWDSEVGGPTVGTGIHVTDLLLHLLGEWTEVRALQARVAQAIEMEDVSSALIRFESGAVASLLNTVVSPRQETRLRLDFEKATVDAQFLYDYGNDNWALTAQPGAATDRDIESWAFPDEIRCSHSVQFAELLTSLQFGKPVPVGLDEVRRTTEFATALYKAAATGQAVRRGSILPGDAFYQHLHGGERGSWLGTDGR
jgi:predicted dehydrogenase